jgi:hypothetical protein
MTIWRAISRFWSSSLAFSNWLKSFSTARWSRFSSAIASEREVLVEVDFDVLLDEEADFFAVELFEPEADLLELLDFEVLDWEAVAILLSGVLVAVGETTRSVISGSALISWPAAAG